MTKPLTLRLASSSARRRAPGCVAAEGQRQRLGRHAIDDHVQSVAAGRPKVIDALACQLGLLLELAQFDHHLGARISCTLGVASSRANSRVAPVALGHLGLEPGPRQPLSRS
jgi:hypothetical protein